VRRGLASGIYNAAGDLGNILGPAIGGFIAQAAGIASVFVIGSMGSTALFLIGMLFVSRLRQNTEFKI
jgi:MFS family permease